MTKKPAQRAVQAESRNATPATAKPAKAVAHDFGHLAAIARAASPSSGSDATSSASSMPQACPKHRAKQATTPGIDAAFKAVGTRQVHYFDPDGSLSKAGSR